MTDRPDNLNAPLRGDAKKSKAKKQAAQATRSRGPLFAGFGLGALTLAVALWSGQANWSGFVTPIVIAEITEQQPSMEITGGVKTVLPIDPDSVAPQNPNEISRTTTSGGAQIIQVRPQTGDIGGEVIIRDPSKLGQNVRMAHLPIPDLIETSGNFRLPVISPDGRRSFEEYARPWSGSAGPRIAIVIGGLGLSQTGTQDAIRKLPEAVTFGFASAGNSLDRWMQSARRAGHEILIQVPLEPLGYPAQNPGRNTLTLDVPASENIERLHWAMARTTNYTGIMNHMGGRFTADANAMAPIMQEIGNRGLLYLDDGSSARSTAAPLAASHGVPFAQANRVIDENRSRDAIFNELAALEQIARSQGSAIGVGSAFDETVSAVAEWMQKAKQRGVEFVPISAIALETSGAR